MGDTKPEQPQRIGPYVFVQEEPVDDALREALERRRAYRGRRATWGFLAMLLPFGCFWPPVGNGASPLYVVIAVILAISGLSGLVWAAWYGALQGTTVRQLRSGRVLRFELDPELVQDEIDPGSLATTFCVFSKPQLLASIGGVPLEHDVPVTIGAAEWPPGLGVPPAAFASAAARLG